MKSGKKWGKVGKGGKRWEKVGKSGEKWEKLGKNGTKSLYGANTLSSRRCTEGAYTKNTEVARR